VKQYLDLLRDVMENGKRKEQRAALSDGTKPYCLSVFGRQVRYDLKEGFPLITTKKMPFKAIVHELIWFLRGDTNIRYLKENGVKIWDAWADESGELGPVYPKQWRRWKGPQGEVDQIQRLVDNIAKVRDNPHHPCGRRLIVTAWNPADMPVETTPTGCHTLAQWNVTNGWLSCQLYQRSGDMLLGVPFNIACYALLTHLLANLTGLKVDEFIHTLGDAHIYSNHSIQVRYQLKLKPHPLPTLLIDSEFTSLDTLHDSMVSLRSYKSHGTIKGEVAV